MMNYDEYISHRARRRAADPVTEDFLEAFEALRFGRETLGVMVSRGSTPMESVYEMRRRVRSLEDEYKRTLAIAEARNAG